MNRNEQEYYANINSIANALDRIANALESNNKVNEGPFVTASDNTIYYKTRRDMYMDNPCTKEEYEAHKVNNIPGFEGTLDALDNLYQPNSTRKAILEQQALNRKIAKKEEQEKLDTQHDYLHQLVKNLTMDEYHEFCNEHCLPASDAVAVSNYITDLDYDEVLGIISDLKAQNKYTYVSKVGKIRNDSDFELRKTAKMYEDDILANGGTKKECILDYVTNVFGSYGARYTDVIKFAYYLGAYNAPKFNNSNRGYYACALTHGRWNTGHLVTGGKDQLVKGINSEGKERYFALSNVDSFTDYYKRLDE